MNRGKFTLPAIALLLFSFIFQSCQRGDERPGGDGISGFWQATRYTEAGHNVMAPEGNIEECTFRFYVRPGDQEGEVECVIDYDSGGWERNTGSFVLRNGRTLIMHIDVDGNVQKRTCNMKIVDGRVHLEQNDPMSAFIVLEAVEGC